MFERFTNRAQEVIGEAKKAAAQLEQNISELSTFFLACACFGQRGK